MMEGRSSVVIPMVNSHVPVIQVVDDTPTNLELLTEMLKAQGYKVRAVPSGKLALQLALSEPPDLILLDIQMPEMDGYEVCEHLKAIEKLAKIPVIFLSALNDAADKTKAFSAGGVDYVTKPFKFEEVRARVDTHLNLRRLQIELERQNHHLQDLVQQQVQQIVDSHMATLFALAKLAESRDDDTGNHIRRVQAYCKVLTLKLNEQGSFQSEIDAAYGKNLFHTAPLHDIGKVGVPDAVLLKPGSLTPSEIAIMKVHTVIGAKTLEEVLRTYPDNLFVRMGVEIARSHHERWDGSGYPDGLRGDGIPLAARIVAVADQYDALRNARPYKPPLSHKETCRIITEGDGRTLPSHFDPRVLRAFVAIRDQCESLFNSFQETGLAA
jgi:putative two-component system response regulator